MEEHWFLADVQYCVDTYNANGEWADRTYHNTKHTVKAPSKHRAELNLRGHYATKVPQASKLHIIIYEAIF